MPTRPKPFTLIKQEGKSHRTKAEMKMREEGEKSLSTGVRMVERIEVRKNQVAHKEFLRLNKLLIAMEKNDAIYEVIINRYCLMIAECQALEVMKSELMTQLKEMENQGLDFVTLIEMRQRQVANVMAADRQLHTKRKMLMDMEKENVMTIAAALRSIPKKVEKSSNKLLKALNDE